MLPTVALICLLHPAAPTPAPAARVLLGTAGVAKGPAAKPDTTFTAGDAHTYHIAPGGVAKMLTADDALHGRPLRLTVVVSPDGRTLRVNKVQTVKGGKVFDVDYWCENCQMSYDEPGACKCCMGETVLRERPAPTPYTH